MPSQKNYEAEWGNVYIELYKAESEQRVYYHSNGQKAAEGRQLAFKNERCYLTECQPWQEDIRFGPWVFWHENGQESARVDYAYDTYIQCCFTGPCEIPYEYQVGRFEYWHENGVLLTEGEFEDVRKYIDTSCVGGDSVRVSVMPESVGFWQEDGTRIRKGEMLERLRRKVISW